MQHPSLWKSRHTYDCNWVSTSLRKSCKLIGVWMKPFMIFFLVYSWNILLSNLNATVISIVLTDWNPLYFSTISCHPYHASWNQRWQGHRHNHSLEMLECQYRICKSKDSYSWKTLLMLHASWEKRMVLWPSSTILTILFR